MALHHAISEAAMDSTSARLLNRSLDISGGDENLLREDDYFWCCAPASAAVSPIGASRGPIELDPEALAAAGLPVLHDQRCARRPPSVVGHGWSGGGEMTADLDEPVDQITHIGGDLGEFRGRRPRTRR